MIQLTIDGKSIRTPEGRSLLEACRENNIHIPTLCYHPAIQPYGACRLCMVEIRQGDRPVVRWRRAHTRVKRAYRYKPARRPCSKAGALPQSC